ncbi:hypothetical protein [Pararobbsia silviterrae]|uniref:Uncharacterized protein n=1 Tax=Pararobbsia silviterrae TaxID=1792498 RepID=A0A494X928_9BURK|nr:hypothetical protein [Pararobbsia silviterrae]RKP44694.1 hypothetical protein D7S86_27070 [Pararobbsia silviterrae]
MISFLIAHWVWFSGGGAALVFSLVAGLLSWIGPTALIANWKAILGAIVAVVVLGVILVLYALLEHTKAALAAEQLAYSKLNGNYQIVLGENATLGADNLKLSSTAALQTATVKAIAAQGAQAKQDAAAAVAAALAAQTSDRATIARLTARINDPSSKNGGCENEIAALRAAL